MSSDSKPVAVLGFQSSRMQDFTALLGLNVDVARAIDSPFLLEYEILTQHHSSRICVYWLWQARTHRDAFWDSRPPALVEFRDSALALWCHEPEVSYYAWQRRAAGPSVGDAYARIEPSGADDAAPRASDLLAPLESTGGGGVLRWSWLTAPTGPPASLWQRVR